MFNLDQITLLTVVGAITLLMGILMLHFAKNNSSISGPSFWSSGSFSVLLAIVSLIFFSESKITIVIASTAAIMGISLYLAGIKSFNQKKINFWFIYGFPALQFLQATVFFFIWPIPFMRIVLFSSFITIIAFLIILEFSKPLSKSYRLAYRMGLVVFIVLGLISFFRIFFTFVYHPKYLLDLEVINVISFFLYCLITILLLFVFVLMITIDLTEKLNEKIASQQKFHSIIAHDLIGPVGSISQILSEINVPGFATEQDRDFLLKDLEQSSVSAYHLLQNLLLWSRNQLDGLTSTITTFDLSKLILQNIRLQQLVLKTKRISIFYAENSGLFCQADARMIDTVIRNLLSNAIKFTHAEGNITVACEKINSEVQISIKDTGIGMSESTLRNIFEEKHREIKAGARGEQGTGLGLMLCKEFIEKNHGSMKLSSKENIGTEILVNLPAG